MDSKKIISNSEYFRSVYGRHNDLFIIIESKCFGEREIKMKMHLNIEAKFCPETRLRAELLASVLNTQLYL